VTECGFAARVDGARAISVTGAFEECTDIPEEARRQVVDAVVPGVLEQSDGDRLARARHAGDEDDAHCWTESDRIVAREACGSIHENGVSGARRTQPTETLAAAHVLLMTLQEVAHCVDATQLQDRVGQSRLGQTPRV